MKKAAFAIIILLILLPGTLCISQNSTTPNLVPNPGFEKVNSEIPESWSVSFPRDEIAPGFSIDNTVSHSGRYSARISSKGSRGTYGSLISSLTGVESEQAQTEMLITMPDTVFLGNSNYLAGCYFKVSEGVDADKNIRIKLTWLDKQNNELFTEFIRNKTLENGWYRAAELKTAPYNATGMRITLILQWAERGSVWWDDIFAEKVAAPANRVVKIASASDWPAYPSTTEKNLAYYAGRISQAGKLGADIICLGEGITVVSTGKSYADASETIPGPSTNRLGEAARKAGTYVIAGLYEREGSLIYNTAVLIDREGNIAGKYRKTHLPQTEVEGGLTPGDTYPVFKTDFGTIGIEICYDNFFPEVSHNLMLNGAEIIFCPIWGDIRGMKSEWDIVARARAIDNAVFFVASMYEKGGSLIASPDGKILPDTGHSEGLIFASVNHRRRIFERWLSEKSFGEWRNLMPNETRPETY